MMDRAARYPSMHAVVMVLAIGVHGARQNGSDQEDGQAEQPYSPSFHPHDMSLTITPPKRGSFYWTEWLRVLATHCTFSDPAWWQVFPVYQTIEKRATRRGGTGRRIVFQWTPPPVVPERVYTSPLLEARRYASLLQRDPFVKTQADLAREMGVSRVRITQVMSLLRLAPEIQEQLRRLTDQPAIRFFSENRLRPLTQIDDPARQLEEFQKLLAQVPS